MLELHFEQLFSMQKRGGWLCTYFEGPPTNYAHTHKCKVRPIILNRTYAHILMQKQWKKNMEIHLSLQATYIHEYIYIFQEGSMQPQLFDYFAQIEYIVQNFC